MILAGTGIIRGIGPTSVPPLAVVVGQNASGILFNWYSADASTWNNASNTIATTSLGVAWSPTLGLFCSVASRVFGATCIQISTDGITWTSATTVPTNLLVWSGITWSPALGLFCAVGFSGTYSSQAMTSPDGLTWTIRNVPNNNRWVRVVWSPSLSLFCAVSYLTQAGAGTPYGVMTSPDGITWTSRDTTVDYFLERIAWSPSLGLFCATSSLFSSYIVTSPDGITWTSRTIPAGTVNFNGIAWSEPLGLFCIVGASGYVCTSPDGITWTTGSSGNSWLWRDICWSNSMSKFIAVGSSTAPGVGVIFYSAMYSTDGITWVNTVTPEGSFVPYTGDYELNAESVAST